MLWCFHQNIAFDDAVCISVCLVWGLNHYNEAVVAGGMNQYTARYVTMERVYNMVLLRNQEPFWASLTLGVYAFSSYVSAYQSAVIGDSSLGNYTRAKLDAIIFGQFWTSSRCPHPSDKKMKKFYFILKQHVCSRFCPLFF